jgi:beta-phosphoglucomutase-like phosphatase (HAD superfamily)
MIHIHPETKVLIFDCDGTIADNMVIHNESWKIVAKRHQIDISCDELPHYNGMPAIDIFYKIAKNVSSDVDPMVIVNEKEALANENIHLAAPIKPVVDIIKDYHTRLPMVVISGGTSDNVNKTLLTLDISNSFDWIITADDDHPTKDSPLAFTKIADKLGVKPDLCHVFEDGKLGLINAIKANMMVTDARVFHP